MALTERESWLLNFYRNSELHGALLMGRLARTITDSNLLVEMTAHCATEARHAAMLSRTIAAAGGRLDPAIAPIQEHYSSEGGVPGTLLEVLVLSETLERRVRASYHRHLAHESPHPASTETLSAIVAEMEAKHGAEHAGWIEQALDTMDAQAIERARQKWQAVDALVAARLEQSLDERFGIRSL
jgi:bacterioferritin (cytochrome b1)